MSPMGHEYEANMLTYSRTITDPTAQTSGDYVGRICATLPHNYWWNNMTRVHSDGALLSAHIYLEREPETKETSLVMICWWILSAPWRCG